MSDFAVAYIVAANETYVSGYYIAATSFTLAASTQVVAFNYCQKIPIFYLQYSENHKCKCVKYFYKLPEATKKILYSLKNNIWLLIVVNRNILFIESEFPAAIKH